jgi:hypothetical protein
LGLAAYRERGFEPRRKKKRNAGGGFMSEREGEVSPLITIGGGAIGGAASVMVAEKVGMTPLWAGVTTTGGALAGRALVKKPWVRDVLLGAAAGATGLVGVQVAAKALTTKLITAAQREQHDATEKAAHATTPGAKRGATDGGDFITRDELQAALSKVADQTKQQHCDLLVALDQITKIVAADQKAKADQSKTSDQTKAGDQTKAADQSKATDASKASDQPAPTPGTGGVPKLYQIYPTRGASIDARDADERDADERDADERDASGEDDYARNAYLVDDERNASMEAEYRDADERDADERDADERDADERDADERDADERDADEG